MVQALPLLRTTFAMVFGARWMELATQFSGQPWIPSQVQGAFLL